MWLLPIAALPSGIEGPGQAHGSKELHRRARCEAGSDGGVQDDILRDEIADSQTPLDVTRSTLLLCPGAEHFRDDLEPLLGEAGDGRLARPGQ